MSIWFGGQFPLDYCNVRATQTLNENLGIVLLDAGEDYLTGSMPVDAGTCNPAGFLHGGASIAFAETLASWAGAFVLDGEKQHCVGLDVNGNHVRPVSAGSLVYGTARPASLGRRVQVWEVRINNEQGVLVCLSRVTMAVLDGANRY